MKKRVGSMTLRSHQPQDRSGASGPPRGLLFVLTGLSAAVPLFIWPSASEYGYTKSIFALVGVGALCMTWAIHAWIRGTWAVRIPRLLLPFGLLIASGLLSMFNALNASVVLQSLLLMLCFGAVFLLVSNLVRTPRDVTLILFALLTAGMLAAVYGLLQYFGVVTGGPGAGPLDPIISTMGNRNYLGGYLAYILLPSIILLVRLKSRILRGVSLLMIVICFGVVLLVNQTGTLIALCVAAVAIFGGWWIFRPVTPISSNRRWLIALVLSAVVIGLFAAPSGPLNSVVAVSDDGSTWLSELWSRSSGQTRSEDWYVGLEMFRDHPVLGVGLGNYKLRFVPYKVDFLASPQGASFTQPIARAAQAHSEYIQTLAELGVVGSIALLGLLAFLLAGFWVRLRANRGEPERFDLLLLLGGIVVFCVHATVSFPAHLPASSWAAVSLVGLAFSSTYGDRHVFNLKIRNRVLHVAVIVLSIACVAVSFVAVRDLSANVLYQQGIEHLDAGDAAGAEQLFAKSIRRDFAARQAYYYLAVAQIQQGEIAQARENLERCLTRFVSEEVYLQLANVHFSTGDFDTANRYLDLLTASRPHGDVADQTSYLRALVAQRQGNPEQAIDILEELIASNSRYFRAYPAIGYVLRSLGRDDEAEWFMASGLTLISARIQRLVDTVSESETVYLTAERYKQISQEVLTLQDALALHTNISPEDEDAHMALGDLYQLSRVLQLGSTPQMALSEYTRASSILRSKIALLQGQLEQQILSADEQEQIESEMLDLREKLRIVTIAISRFTE